MLQRLDRADAEHREQSEGHVGRAEVFEHVARQRERQALPAVRGRAGDGVPALRDIGVIGGLEALGQADHAILELRAFQIALAVERRKLSGSELADAFDDGLDQVRLGMLEALGLRQLLDPGIDADGEQLVGGRRGEGGHLGGVLKVGNCARPWQGGQTNIAPGHERQERYGSAAGRA